jgi:hypothetical protein
MWERQRPEQRHAMPFRSALSGGERLAQTRGGSLRWQHIRIEEGIAYGEDKSHAEVKRQECGDWDLPRSVGVGQGESEVRKPDGRAGGSRRSAAEKAKAEKGVHFAEVLKEYELMHHIHLPR